MKYLRRNNWFQIKHNGGTKVKDISYIYTAGNQIKTVEILLSSLRKISQQAGAELCQAQVKLEVVVEFGVEFGIELEPCHY